MLPTMLRTLLVLVLAALVSLGSSAEAGPYAPNRPAMGPPPAYPAGPPPRPYPGGGPPGQEAPKPGKVETQVMVVYATNSHNRVDPRLNSLNRVLGRLNYTGYEVLATESCSLDRTGDECSFSVAGGSRVTIGLLSKDTSRVRLRVQIVRGRGTLLDTNVSVNRGGTFIVAGPRHADGILVLPLTVRY